MIPIHICIKRLKYYQILNITLQISSKCDKAARIIYFYFISVPPFSSLGTQSSLHHPSFCSLILPPTLWGRLGWELVNGPRLPSKPPWYNRNLTMGFPRYLMVSQFTLLPISQIISRIFFNLGRCLFCYWIIKANFIISTLLYNPSRQPTGHSEPCLKLGYMFPMATPLGKL